ncbi:hypothetical protein AGMMS50284_5930 [Clostridia bacterium]|nr:hypothetical protein AGMMS50284_5930 [Clostridia bacterium]
MPYINIQKYVSVEAGKTSQITVKTNAITGSLKWSSNTSIATVASDGKVTGKKEGFVKSPPQQATAKLPQPVL